MSMDLSHSLPKLKVLQTKKLHSPIFHREIEASVADEGVIFSTAKLIIVEGNYLLSTEYGWGEVRQYLDTSFYLRINEDIRIQRLIARHIEFGKDPVDATIWATKSDESNAKFIEQSSQSATYVIDLNP